MGTKFMHGKEHTLNFSFWAHPVLCTLLHMSTFVQLVLWNSLLLSVVMPAFFALGKKSSYNMRTFHLLIKVLHDNVYVKLLSRVG